MLRIYMAGILFIGFLCFLTYISFIRPHQLFGATRYFGNDVLTSVSGITFTNGTGTNLIWTNATGTNLIWTNASGTNTSSTNLFIVNGNVNNSLSSTNLSWTNATGTNTTSTYLSIATAARFPSNT